MTLFTGHLGVQSSERKSRFVVVESLSRLPVRKVMTLETFLSQLSLVRVLVTADAVL